MQQVLPSVYNAMAQVISQADLEDLVLFSEELRTGISTRENQTNNIVTALQNKVSVHITFTAYRRSCIDGVIMLILY